MLLPSAPVTLGFSQHLPDKYHRWKPKKVLPLEHWAPGTIPYDKTGPCYCNVLITRLDEGMRLQLLGQKPLILPGLYIQISWRKLNWGGPGPLIVKIIGNYCSTRVLLYAKYPKRNNCFFCHIFIIGGISIGRGGRGGPLLGYCVWVCGLCPSRWAIFIIFRKIAILTQFRWHFGHL